jgi:hypothetical protein
MGNRREMEESKRVPVALPVGHNEPPVPTGCQAQPREPKGDKKGIISMALNGPFVLI